MEGAIIDEGWADFASFAGDEEEDAALTTTGRIHLSNFDNNESTTDCCPSISAAEYDETKKRLKDCFNCGFDSTSLPSLSIQERTSLENEIADTRLWKDCNTTNLEFLYIMKWEKSNWQKIFLETMFSFLETEDSTGYNLIPEELEISSFIRCFNFHKFANRGKRTHISKAAEQPNGNPNEIKNPAAELNPFAPNKLTESNRCASNNSIDDTNSITSNNSVENLLVKEVDCISVTSIESASSGILVNGDPDAILESKILEKWKKIRVGCIEQDKRGLEERFSLDDLRTLVSDVKQSCSTLSESLVKELRNKDDLLRDKKLRDDFISLLLGISRKQKAQEVSQTSRRQRILFLGIGNVENNDKKFPDVSIPYIPTEDGPNPETIRSLRKILQAILDEDPKFPSLVTDYTMQVIKEMQNQSMSS